MTEEFLQYIWRYNLFTGGIQTAATGESVEVLHPGYINTDSGPDFFNAKARINGTVWVGNVEIHMNSSDWLRHGHHNDKAYENVILHVVSNYDAEVKRQSGGIITTLILNYKKKIEEKYRKLISNRLWISCQNDLKEPLAFQTDYWIQSLLIERLEEKSAYITGSLQKNNNNWEETFYQQLARNFGMKVNEQPFELLARSLPLKYLARHKDNLLQVEAMLFGQAGLLDHEKCDDDYFLLLKREYEILRKKFSLRPLEKHHWKFLRLRPLNFPTIRIAQFASLINRSSSLFSKIIGSQTISQIKELFNVSTSPYWETHYVFGKATAKRTKHAGDGMISTVIINTVSPFLFVYGKQHDSEFHCELAVKLPEELKPEQNSIINNWTKLGFKISNASYSQAFIHLKKNYCDAKKCLNCRIGNKIITLDGE
jgi:hypothetical protein